jgi:hypothetical protein
MKKNRTTLGRKLNKPRGHIFGATWLGMPTKFVQARVVSVIVGDSTDEKYWAREYVGLQLQAVEVKINVPAGVTKDGKPIRETFYLDNELDSAVHNLTVQRGDIRDGHRQLLIQRIVDDPTIELSYGFKNPSLV